MSNSESAGVETFEDLPLESVAISVVEQVLKYFTGFTHLGVLIFTFVVIYLVTQSDYTLFIWHPLLLCIGWFLIMTEGVLILSTYNSLSRRLSYKWKIRLHWILQSIGFLPTVVGFVLEVIYKESKNKTHFKSYHALFGLIAFVLAMGPTVLSGISALFSFELKNLITPKVNRLIHNLFGLLSVCCGGFSILLSVYSNWFMHKTDRDLSMFILCFSVILLCILCTLTSPLQSFLSRVKSMNK